MNLSLKKSVYLIAAGLILFNAGCSSKNDVKAIHIDRDGIDTIANDGALKVSFIKNKNSPEMMCAYREPDVEAISHQGLKLTIPGKEGIGEDSGSSAVTLGGRSPALLIVREMLYRACELSMNLNADKNTTIEVYKMFLDTSKQIAAQSTEGTKSTTVSSDDSLTIDDALQKDLNKTKISTNKTTDTNSSSSKKSDNPFGW